MAGNPPVHRLRLLCAGLIALALGGCAALPPPTPLEADSGWRRHAEAVGRITAWDLQGRVALTLEGEAWHASLLWQQLPDSYRLRLSSPLGQGVAMVEGRAGEVRIALPDGTRDRAADAETLLRRHLGWRLPVDGLAWWVRGLPRPGPEARPRFDDAGRLVRLEQSGWRIDYLDYVRVGGQDLPRRVFLASDHLEVRLVVSHWTLPPDGG